MGTDRVYTRAEKARRFALLVKGAKRSAGDVSAIERELDRIDATAEDRARREGAAWQRSYDTARDALAAARVAERCAKRSDRPARRADRLAAEKRLRAVERGQR